MNQQQKVEQVFVQLLKSGSTTSLDVKNKLREEYPTEYWTQDYVSPICSKYAEDNNIPFNDNGTWREYYTTTTPSRQYSYNNNGVTITANTPDEVIEAVSNFGIDLHWSNTDQKFVDIADMNEQYLYNAIKLHLEESNLNWREFYEFINRSPYMAQLEKNYYNS